MYRQFLANNRVQMRYDRNIGMIGRKIGFYFPMQPVAMPVLARQYGSIRIHQVAGFVYRIFVTRKMVHIIPGRNV